MGKEMGMRLQGTQAECVVPPWMCPVPGACQPPEDFRGQFRIGTSRYSNSEMLRSSQHTGKSFVQLLQEESTGSGGINPQEDP